MPDDSDIARNAATEEAARLNARARGGVPTEADRAKGAQDVADYAHSSGGIPSTRTLLNAQDRFAFGRPNTD